MHENYLSCEIRVGKRIHKKNAAATISDLVKRDYDNTKHNQIIRAIHVKYVTCICAPFDAPQNFVLPFSSN